MALPSAPIQNAAYSHQPSVQVVINNNPSQMPAVHQQPNETTPRMLKAQQPRAPRSFLGRMVERITQSKRYQKAADFTNKTFKPLKEWAVDFGGALKILGKETWKGVSRGALSGLAAGGVVTFLCPPLIGPAFTVSITAGVTAGGIMGYLSGAAKASDYYDQARQARRDAAETVKRQ